MEGKREGGHGGMAWTGLLHPVPGAWSQRKSQVDLYCKEAAQRLHQRRVQRRIGVKVVGEGQALMSPVYRRTTSCAVEARR